MSKEYRVKLEIDIYHTDTPEDAVRAFRNMSMQEDANWMYIAKDLETGEEFRLLDGVGHPDPRRL